MMYFTKRHLYISDHCCENTAENYLISDTSVLFGIHVAIPIVSFKVKPGGCFKILNNGFLSLSSEALNCIYTGIPTSTLIDVFPAMLGVSFSIK